MAKKDAKKSDSDQSNGKQDEAKTDNNNNNNDKNSEDIKNKNGDNKTNTDSVGFKRLILASALFVAAVAIAVGTFLSDDSNRIMVGNVVVNNTAYTPAALQPYQEYFGNILAGNAEIDVSHFQEQWNSLRSSIEAASSDASVRSDSAVGRRLKQQGVRAKHPVFMIPGFVTSGLEVWEGHECAIKYFRRKIWGSMETFRSFAQDTTCWKQHLSLDPKTGKDPHGIRLRPSQGFEAADFWTSAFWVWDRVIRNLASVGYDGSNMELVSYDWRLSFPALEERDGHFSKLKSRIESFVDYTGEKAVLMGHSMGGPKVFFFLVWVGRPKEEGGGGGGPDWVEKYIHAYVNLAGPLLGMPKAASALLSGDMKETNLYSPIGGLIESMFGRKKRHELFSSWGSLWGMAPKGGDTIWGVTADIECGKGKVPRGELCVPEDEAGEPKDIPILTFTDPDPPKYDNPVHAKYANKTSWSYNDVIQYLTEWKEGDHGPKSLNGTGSWNDPLQHSLPKAPSLNVYCLYGVGLPTERMFYYRRQPLTNDGDVPFVMNDTVKDDPSESIRFGLRTTNGDGSVPLISNGYMCAHGWKDQDLNPGNSHIVTKEYPHEGSFQMDDPMRQGPKSSEHCDILGNHETLEDLIKIATGEKVEARVVSNIQQIANEIEKKKKQ